MTALPHSLRARRERHAVLLTLRARRGLRPAEADELGALQLVLAHRAHCAARRLKSRAEQRRPRQPANDAR